MITNAVVQFAVGFLSIVCGWFPKQPAVDQVVVTAGGFLQPIVDGAASLGVWVPWGTIGACMAVVVPLFIATFLFKTLRALASYIPLVGGAG